MQGKPLSRPVSLFVSVAGLAISGLLGIFLGKVIDRWGVLDGPANQLGDFLKANVDASDLGLILGLVISACLYGAMLWWVWSHTRKRPKSQPTPPINPVKEAIERLGPHPLGKPPLVGPLGGMSNQGAMLRRMRESKDREERRKQLFQEALEREEATDRAKTAIAARKAADEAKAATFVRRRELISLCRDIVHRYREAGMPEPFGAFVERDRAYLDVRPHLGDEYWKGVIGRVELADAPHKRDYECAMFDRELARLAKEWELE